MPIKGAPPSGLPGHDITSADYILRMDIDDGKVAVLHSEHGVEGVFTSGNILHAFFLNLRRLSAYRDASLSVSLHELNPVL